MQNITFFSSNYGSCHLVSPNLFSNLQIRSSAWWNCKHLRHTVRNQMEIDRSQGLDCNFWSPFFQTQQLLFPYRNIFCRIQLIESSDICLSLIDCWFIHICQGLGFCFLHRKKKYWIQRIALIFLDWRELHQFLYALRLDSRHEGIGPRGFHMFLLLDFYFDFKWTWSYRWH